MKENAFDSKAKEWDKEGRRRELADAIAAALAKLQISDDMTAMEFGCGTGLVGLQIAPQLSSLIAFDSSPGMIAELEGKISAQNIKNIKPVQGDILTYNVEEKFDFIFSSMTMHHVDEINPVLEKLHGLLKKDGLFAIADLDTEDGSFHNPGMEEKHHGFDRRIFKEKLEEIGFSSPDFTTPHVVKRETKEGTIKDFPVFLAVCRKR